MKTGVGLSERHIYLIIIHLASMIMTSYILYLSWITFQNIPDGILALLKLH